jgi:hypothetical protein
MSTDAMICVHLLPSVLIGVEDKAIKNPAGRLSPAAKTEDRRLKSNTPDSLTTRTANSNCRNVAYSRKGA